MSAKLNPKIYNNQKKNYVYIVLVGIFITNAITAEIIGVKIFSLEDTFGVSPSQINLWGEEVFSFNLTAGVIIWPVVFLTTDIINEYFGKEGVKKVTYLTIILISYVFLVLWIVTILSPAQFWLEVNNKDVAGNDFNINTAYSTIFRQGGGIIIGSLTAFLIGQLLDAYVFIWIKNKTGGKMIWLRSTGSTLVSQLVDSFVVLFIAFYVFGGQQAWTLSMVVSVGIINYCYKFVIAVLMTPVIYIAHYIIDRYLYEDENTIA